MQLSAFRLYASFRLLLGEAHACAAHNYCRSNECGDDSHIGRCLVRVGRDHLVNRQPVRAGSLFPRLRDSDDRKASSPSIHKDPERGENPLGQIEEAPTHDAMDGWDRATLHDLPQHLALAIIENAGGAIRDLGKSHRSTGSGDGGSDRDRVMDAQAFAAKQRQSPGEAELEQTWQAPRKAVCHVESDKSRFGNRPRESNFQSLGMSSLMSINVAMRPRSTNA
jgi:hypothetical protein